MKLYLNSLIAFAVALPLAATALAQSTSAEVYQRLTSTEREIQTLEKEIRSIESQYNDELTTQQKRVLTASLAKLLLNYDRLLSAKSALESIR